MTAFVRTMLAVLAAVFMGTACLAADGARKLVVVRPEGSWPPWEMLVDGEPRGVHIELVQEASRMLNLAIEVRTYPWKRAIQMLETGEADAITYMSKTAERERFGYFLPGNVLSSTKIGFFVLKKNEGEFRYSGNLKSLQPYTIGTCRGFSYDEAFDTATFLAKDDGAPDEYTLLKKLLAGRLQIAVGYVNDVKYTARQMGVADQIVFLQPNLSEDRAVYLVFSKAKHHEALARRFADAMRAYKATPRYAELMKKYGAE